MDTLNRELANRTTMDVEKSGPYQVLAYANLEL